MIIRPALTLEGKYTIMSNAWARDSRISLKARGLLFQLLSHSPGWRVSVESLVRDNPEGREAIRTTIIELAEFGYLVVIPQKNDSGQFAGVDYIIADMGAGLPVVGKPDVGLSDDGLSEDIEEQLQENQVQEENTQEQPSPKIPSFDDQMFAEAWEAWPKRAEKKTAQKAYDKAVRANRGVNVLAEIKRFGAAYRATTHVSYIPGLAPWLNGERWTDDLPVAHATAPRPKPKPDWMNQP